MSGRTEGGAKECNPAALTPLATFPLGDARHALGVALPFGHTHADTLATFAATADALDVSDLRLAPKRILLALCPTQDAALALQREAGRLDLITSAADPRLSISACPGAPACASGHLPARQLATEIAARAAGVLDGSIHLHISGCAKGCAHPAAAGLTLVGSENGAGIVVGGTARARPLAYTAPEGAKRAVGLVADLLRRRAGEDTAAVLARTPAAHIAQAFEKQ